MYVAKSTLLRNPTLKSSLFNRVKNREDVLKITHRVVRDADAGTELHILGTMNVCDQSAYRTKALIEKVKPDTVLVQADSKWWDIAKHLEFVKSQDEMHQYHDVIDASLDVEKKGTVRNNIFRVRWTIFKTILSFITGYKADVNVLHPGLEVKFAVESANKNKSHIIWAGRELDESMLERIYLEKRLAVSHMIYNFFCLPLFWVREIMDQRRMMITHGTEAYCTQVLDHHRVAWWMAFGEKIVPYSKRIFVEHRDEDLFHKLVKESQGKKIVAVVNQFHMEGLEQHWRKHFNLPVQLEAINPTGDMNLTDGLKYMALSNQRREYVKQLTGWTTSSLSNYIAPYSMETNFHYTHRFSDG